MKPFLASLAVTLGALTLGAAGTRRPPVAFTTSPGAMAAMSVAVDDHCAETAPTRVSAVGVWVDGRYEHELLLFPGSHRQHYDTLLGPFAPGGHRLELRPSAYWKASDCLATGSPEVEVVPAGSDAYTRLRHAPVLELRADTVGEQTDSPLFAYVEDLPEQAAHRLRYTVVFSNEDGGTETRALLSRWGRTTDIEQVYDVVLRRDGGIQAEAFQGPDHEIRTFAGRRRGTAPILLVATLNNMVTDRGRGTAAVRLVPEPVDLSRATRESTLDAKPWAYQVMAREIAAEGRIVAGPPSGDHWLRHAPDPREHLYLEARLTLHHALAAAWATLDNGERLWSHYQRESLALDRDGWVRTAVAIGPDPGSKVAAMGWACLPDVRESAAGTASGPGTCRIEATRAFAFGPGWAVGPNLTSPKAMDMRAGEEVSLQRR